MTYSYLKHVEIPRKCILTQVSSEGSTAQSGRKVVKIAKIHPVTIGAHTAKSDLKGLANPEKSLENTQNDLFVPQICINTQEMHSKTSFIGGKYRPKWSESGQHRENPL